MLGRHDGPRGRLFDGHYRALGRRLGPFEGLARDYASATAALFVTWWDAQQALEAAQRQRRDGRGRRPSTQRIGQLQKRAGLQWASYDQALIRLEAIASSNGHGRPADPLAAVRQAVAEANRP